MIGKPAENLSEALSGLTIGLEQRLPYLLERGRLCDARLLGDGWLYRTSALSVGRQAAVWIETVFTSVARLVLDSSIGAAASITSPCAWNGVVDGASNSFSTSKTHIGIR
jgi:hypothetical protein